MLLAMEILNAFKNTKSCAPPPAPLYYELEVLLADQTCKHM